MTPEERAEYIKKIRAQRQGAMTPTPVAKNVEQVSEKYGPKTVPNHLRDDPFLENNLERIGDLGQTALATAKTMRFNTDAYNEAERRRELLEEARRNLRRVKRMPTQEIPFYEPRLNVRGLGGKKAPGAFKGFGKDFNPNALTTIDWRGHKLTVNPVAAPAFTGFLNDLWKMGYRPKVIGSYANRNIAGTNVKSLHSHGLAIDIDPAQNPVTWDGKVKTILPKGIGKIARKWGLEWGGNWRGNKTDSMHFSIPYGGRK